MVRVAAPKHTSERESERLREREERLAGNKWHADAMRERELEPGALGALENNRTFALVN